MDYRQPGYEDTGWSYANLGSARRFPAVARAGYAALRDRSARILGREFDNFLRQEVQLTDNRYGSIHELNESQEFSNDSFYCVGSDQVWNLNYNVDNSPYYLDFAPIGAPKFSVSSSIGASRLPLAEEDHLKRSLESFRGVSVRELEAAEYLNSLGIPAVQHVDPTLGVDPLFWHEFAGPEVSEDPYILVYQLNGSKDFPEIAKVASKRLGIPQRRVEYWRGPRSFLSRSVILPSVQEFVRLFRDSAFVVTDSFHGTTFSTIFSRPFIAVAPPKYAGRISSLLKLTGQEARLARSRDEAIDVATRGLNMHDSRPTLDAERLKIRSYLTSVTGSRTPR